MGGMVRLLATLGAAGLKALKSQKRKARRKSLGLPEKTKMQQRSSDKVKESASKFVKRRKQLGGPKSVMPVKKAMGGEAAESVGRATVERSQRKIRRKEVDDMLDRVYGKGIKPKKKPKDPNRIKPKKKPKLKPLKKPSEMKGLPPKR